MKFELGKCYQHTSGEMMSIIGKANTCLYGDVLVAETSDSSSLMPVGTDDDAAVNWSEITKGKWLSIFSREENLPPVFTEKIFNCDFIYPDLLFYPTDVVNSALKNIKETQKQIFGKFGSPKVKLDSEDMDLTHISHEVKNLQIGDGVVTGDIYILSTPEGKELWDYMQKDEVEFKCAMISNFERKNNIDFATNIRILEVFAIPKEKKYGNN